MPDHDDTQEHDARADHGLVIRTPAECRGPAPIPWLEHDRCMYFFEARTFECPRSREQIRLRVTFEHRLCLVGRQQGPLLYTTTLLPGETVTIYENDRYRRIRSETERVTVHTSFRQTLSALSQSRQVASASAYADSLTKIRTEADASVSTGGGLAGFLGLPSGSGSASASLDTTIATGSSLQRVSDDFVQLSRTASQAVEAERALVVSSFEDSEFQQVTQRHLTNDNHCYAVTYFVRRVNEVYEVSTRVADIEWRTGDQPWRSTSDLTGIADRVRRDLRQCLRLAPKAGDATRESHRMSLPTDGTLYEAELAHCSSCEPAREAEIRAHLERLHAATVRAGIETEILALELERRRTLASGDTPVALDVAEWAWSGSQVDEPQMTHLDSE